MKNQTQTTDPFQGKSLSYILGYMAAKIDSLHATVDECRSRSKAIQENLTNQLTATQETLTNGKADLKAHTEYMKTL